MHTQATSATTLRGNFVLLKADSLQLLLPQSDVGAAQYLGTPPHGAGETGLFELDALEGEAIRQVAALSPQMDLMAQFPPGRFLLAAMAAEPSLAFCWSEVKVLIDAELQPQALAPVMLPPGAPVREFVELADGLAYLCTGENLLGYALATRR